MKKLKFAVALPAFNEQDVVESSILEIDKVLDTLDVETMIIVVNDGSLDKTRELLDKISITTKRLDVVHHAKNIGYGGACFSALKRARALELDYVLFMDCDLTQDPKYIKNFIPKMEREDILIKASRYIEGGEVLGVSRFRRHLSWAGNKVAGALWRVPLTDFTNGFRAVKVDALPYLNMTEKGFPALMEEIYYLSFLTKDFSEVPYTLTVRTHGASSFSYSYKTFYSYLKYPLKSFFRIKPDLVNVEDTGNNRKGSL